MLHITALPFNVSCVPGASRVCWRCYRLFATIEGSVKGQNVLTRPSFPFDKVRAMLVTAGLGCHLCTLPATVIDSRYEALLVDDIERPASSIEDTFSIEYHVGTSWASIPPVRLAAATSTSKGPLCEALIQVLPSASPCSIQLESTDICIEVSQLNFDHGAPRLPTGSGRHDLSAWLYVRHEEPS